MALGLEITELRLGLPGGDQPGAGGKSATETTKKRVFSEIGASSGGGQDNENSCSGGGDSKTPAKIEVVGWPPVGSYRRRNSMSDQQQGSKIYVKVSMDGAPFLRKVDLGLQKGYSELATALEKLFDCHGIREALKGVDSSEHVPIYEDSDGDWMLVGDVPWQMFIESCKRLRIMKRSETKGFDLQPKGEKGL
ncbi:auxin-induced protein AUX22-like [Prosopis cineraria]|uniref:auxin-induced protein AUX22-like n=1 Tax=Prosopis cineraria TaxID=364024 RepID=UPI002410A28E|nr:auxin-induced protein AUX22-like [Prosopis cineraria]